MKTSKLSPALAKRLANARSGEVVEVVLELRRLSVRPGADLPRAERIAFLREAFRREAVPVEAAIESAGGEVLADIWINQTIFARIPAQSVASLNDLDEILLLDLPRTLELVQH